LVKISTPMPIIKTAATPFTYRYAPRILPSSLVNGASTPAATRKGTPSPAE
jgi:hypothetical protein